MGGAWPQILIIKSLLISSVCLNAIAVDTITLESRQSAKQNAKNQLPINRSKRQGSRGYNDYWHYLIDRQAYFADELLTAHKPCGPYKPFDMHVLSPDGFTHHSSEDVYDPNVDIFQPDFVQPPMMYNDFVPPHLFPAPFGPNIHPRAKGERPMTYVTKSSPRRPDCNSSRSHSVIKSKLCHQNHRRPFIKGARNCIPPVQRCRKTKSDAAQCDLNAVQRISSQNATHIVIMHLGENNCICVHYIRKTTGVPDTDTDAKLEITTEEVLDDSTSIPVTTDSTPIASTVATITLAPATATSSMHIPVDAYTSSISTSDSPSSPRRSSSNGNELNRTFSYTPRPLSRTTISPSDENIILDSSPSSAQDFSSNKQTGRPAALPDQPVTYHTTPRTTSKEHIVLDSIYSTTVLPDSSKKSNVGTLSSGDLASIVKPSSSYKFTSTSEGTTITIKNTTSESLEKYSASRINTSSTENISSAYLDTSKILKVPSTPSSIPSSSSTLSPINSSDSFAGQIASSTIYTTTTNTPSPVSKSTLTTTAIYGTTSTPSLRTTKYYISDLHSNYTASPTSTQNPKAAYSRSLVSTYSPPPDSTFSYSPAFYPKLIPAATTKTTLRPASATAYSLVSTYVAESAKTTPLPSIAMDLNYTTNSDSKSTSLTNTMNATFTSSSKLSTVLHRNTSFVSHSAVINSNSSLHTKSPLVSKDVKNSTVHEKGPLLSLLHKEEETHPGRHGSERTHVPMGDVQNTYKLPTELYTNRNKDGRENSSWMASKGSIEETLSVTKQENMASYFKEGRVISSVISHSAESVDNDLEPTTSFKKDLSSSGVIAKSQGSKTVGNKSENIRNNSEKDNSTSKHHDSKRIPPKLDDVSFVLSTELESNRASVKKERVVQTSDTFPSIISKVEGSAPTLGHISNLKDKEPSNVKLTTKEGSRVDLNKGGRLKNSSEKDHINSSNSNSQGTEPIPIKVDNVSNSFVGDLGTISTLKANVSNTTVLSTQQGSTTVHYKDGIFVSSSKKINTNSSNHDSGSNPIKLEDISNTFVLSREQNSNTTIVKNERGFASSSAISKTDSSNDALRDISKEKVHSTTIPTTQQGPTPVHNKGGRFESSSEKNRTTVHSGPHDSEYTSEFVLSTDKDFSNTQLKNERVVQSSFSSSSTTSKQYSAGNVLKSNSNVKDNTPGTSVLNTKQESRTIQNKDERLESSFEKDNSDGFGLIPYKLDEESNSFVLPREHESNTARNKNERVVQSSIVSSSAISKSNTTDDDVRVISKLKDTVPSMNLSSTKGGYRIIHNEDGRLESSSEKDNRKSRHDDRNDPIPIHDDDFLSAFVLSAEKEFSKGQIKNEKVVQPSFASSPVISKAHSTVDDFRGISKLTNSMSTPIAPATNQGSRTSHNKEQITVESSHTASIPIHVDDVSSAFVLSTEQETRKAQTKNERIVQSSFAPSSADSNDDDLKSISNFRDASTSTMVLNSKQESKTFHHKIEHLKNSTHRYNANLSHHDSEPISTKSNATLNTFALPTAKESSAAHTKTERIVQSSFASSSAISKTDSTSNLKDQGFRTVHNKDGRLVSTHSEAVPIHVDDVSGSFVLSREQESSKSQIENQRIVQSSFGSSSAISKADSTNHDLKSISYFMHDIPSTIVLSPNQRATIKYHNGGGLESSSKIDNSNSRHHVSEPIKFTVGNFSNSFMLSKPSAAHIQNKTVVQSSFASASAISKTDSTGYDLGPITKENGSQSKQGPTTVHDEGGRLENFSEKVNGKSRHHNSQTIPTHVDDVTHTFVLPTQQQSAAAYAKNERVVHSSFASASAMSKADSPDDDLGSISNAKENLPSNIALLTNDGHRTIHSEGEKLDKKNVNSGQDDSHATPIQVADVSHTLVISQKKESALAHAKNETVVQSTFASASAVSKSHSTDDSLRPISNFKDSVPSTILLPPKQGPTTIHYEGRKLGYYFEKDKGSSRQNDSQTVPIYVDNVMHTLELTNGPQSAAAHAKHERVVHSSFASASAVSKSPATDDGLRPMTKDNGSVPNTIVLPPKQGPTAIHYEAGRLEHFIEKDNGSTQHDSQTSPINLDDVRRTFVLPTQQKFSEAYAKNERVVQSSFASSSAISKADPTDDDLGHTSKDKDNPTSTIALSTKEDPTTFHKEDGKLDYVDYDKDNGNSGQEDSQTIPIHVYGVSVGESAAAHIKNERVVLSSFASASAISKSHSTDHDLEPIFKLKGDVPGSLDLSNEQGSRRVYNKVRSEEISSKTDNKNTRHDDPSSIPNKFGDYSRSYVLTADQESMKAQSKNEKVVQSSFASNAAINKNEPISNHFKWIANFKKDISNTSVLSQTAGNQHHQQFDRMDLLEELYNLERINQSSHFTTSPSTSSTRNSSTRTEMSNERNVDRPNVSSSKKYVEGQEIKMLQTGSKEMETLKDHRDNKFSGVSDRNSKDTESKDLKSNGMHPSVMDDKSAAIDLGSSHHIFSYESSEGDTSRENYPIDNSNENESTQILTSTLVEKIAESGNTADSSKVPPNSNGDLRALQFGSTAARTQNKNRENSHDTLKLDAGRSTANIKDKDKVPGRFSFRSFGIFKDNKANDRDSEEIDAEDVPENSSELSSECETSNESEAEILDTLRLETDKIGEKRNYVSGTGSRFMHVLRSPNERYPYYSSEATFAEPLVPGVYTTKRNEFKYKSRYPTTIYWRRIEPKTRICNSRLRELRPFEADDLEDGHASPEYYDIDLIDC